MIGVDSGYELYVGGNGGIKTEVAQFFCKVASDDEVLEYGGAFIQLCEEGFYLERTCTTLGRVGLEHVKRPCSKTLAAPGPTSACCSRCRTTRTVGRDRRRPGRRHTSASSKSSGIEAPIMSDWKDLRPRRRPRAGRPRVMIQRHPWPHRGLSQRRRRSLRGA